MKPKINYIILPFLLFLLNVNASEWDYEGYGPDEWPFVFSTCNGLNQSPININTNQVFYNQNLKDIKFNNFFGNYNWSMFFNNHTIILKPIDAVLSISGSDFDETYNLSQFHFHWGFNDYQGSEHEINGKKFPLEIHMVHQAPKGRLAVVSILFRISNENNSDLEEIFNQIDNLNHTNPFVYTTFDMKKLINNVTEINSYGYYRYTGSLTTPPCTENVLWNILEYKINISSKQLEIFHEKYFGIYFRPIQELNSRKVYSSKCMSALDSCNKSEKSICNSIKYTKIIKELILLNLISILFYNFV